MKITRIRQQTTKLSYVVILLCLLALNSGLTPTVRAQTTTSFSVIATIPVGTDPYGIAVNENTNRIYVTNYLEDTVSVIDGSTNTVIATVPVILAPLGVSVNPITNRIYVANHNSGSPLSVIDGSTNSVIAQVPVYINATGVTVNPNTNRIYVTVSGQVDVIDGSSDTVVSTILPVNPGLGPNGGIVVNPTNNLIYVIDGNSLIQVIDGNTNTHITNILGVVSQSNNPFGIALNSDTNRIYVPSAGISGFVSIIDGASNTLLGTVPMQETDAFPLAVAANKSTNHIFVANFNSSVSILDGATNTFLGDSLSIPGHLLGVAVNSVTNRVYVTNSSDNTVVVIEDTSLPPTPTPSPTPIPTGEIDYFALGDSIAAGHGLPEGGDVEFCRQSARAYPNKVRDALRTRYEKVNFYFLACSGATAKVPDAKTLKQDPKKFLQNQVDFVLANLFDRPTLVSITIGANDFEWADTYNVIRRLSDSPAKYLTWANQTADAVGQTVRFQVHDLLEHENVAVVITQIHNPANKESNFFKLYPGRPCANVYNVVDCYDRFAYAVNLLNSALVLDVYVPLGSPERLRIATINAPLGKDFSSPRTSCGSALPDAGASLVQYPGDPNSNSLLPWTVRKLWGIGNTPGDCFHPNETGAQVYADAVNTAAQEMGR